MGKNSINKLKIVRFGDPVLRQAAKPVTVFHKKLHALIDSIALTLRYRDDGAALAANQVGILKQVVVVNYEGAYLELINPEIISSDGEQIDNEGCLSFPGYSGVVKRFDYVKVKYYDRYGEEKLIETTGLLARCLQHEIDHLRGILYIDRIKDDHLTNTSTKETINLKLVLDLSEGKIEDILEPAQNP